MAKKVGKIEAEIAQEIKRQAGFSEKIILKMKKENCCGKNRTFPTSPEPC